jgi:ribosomal protein L25 (general stress protein Ctc)
VSGQTVNDASDRKQLAECIAASVPYFITLDKEILDLSEQLYEKYSIEILRPVEFVLIVDEISNSFDYRSFRLAGANYDSEKLRGEDVENLVDSFSGIVSNEKKQDLRELIARCVKDLRKGRVRIIRDKDTMPIAIYGFQFEDRTLSLELVRLKKNHISAVLFQQLIRDVILFTIEQKLSLVVLKEPNFSDEQKNILTVMGFAIVNNYWQKLCLGGVHPLNEVLTNPAVEMHFKTQEIKLAIQSSAASAKQVLTTEFERKLWPAKISDLDLPVYIIPIRPYWASQLFDFYLANVSLFGASESLSWSRENIYYRSVNPVSEKAPARILWYVSSDEKATGRSKGIVATSYLDDVYVDRAKEIFRKYRRFGVYEWRDIYKLVEGAILSEIKALKFSDTEVFKKIIPLDTINEILEKHNRLRSTFPSPLEVSISIFNEIYLRGINE